MSTQGRLQSWRVLADQIIRALHEVNEHAFGQKQRIDEDFPHWKVKRNQAPDQYWTHDARREFFVTVQVILESAQLSYVFMRDYLTNATWWDSNANKVSDAKIESTLKEQAIMIKWYSFHALAVATEETFRAIAQSTQSTFPIKGYRSYKSVYSKVLEVLELQKYESFMDILRLARNTLHTNGIYSPEQGGDQQLSYAGELFSFERGQPLAWFDDKRLVWFARNIIDVMTTVIRAPAVTTISECPRAAGACRPENVVSDVVSLDKYP